MNEHEQPRLVVGVGASAGGLEAFRELLSVIPSDSGMAILLVQHLDPTHRSLLAELLTPVTEMSVTNADQDVTLRPNVVYIIRPDTALAVRGGKIELTPPTLHRGIRLPVDHLFRSLAAEYGPRSVGIILSGAGSDGSAGVRSIKTAGGLSIAQEPNSCGQPGMPRSAIGTGVVDLVMDITQMPAALDRFANLPPGARVERVHDAVEERAEQLASLGEQDISRLAAVLEAQRGFDLQVYKVGTIERRVLRRMALAGFDDIEPYLDQLRAVPSEQQTLVRDLLISVTEFFRDVEAYRALRELVIAPLVAEAEPGSTMRAWVPGCATGEEAYSLGMEFLDAIQAQQKRLSVQIFATDVDQDALAFARTATYPLSVAEQVSQQRLDTYFERLDGLGYQVRSPLRDVLSFAVHDITKDPPFSRMNLVSCRNVLIYLNAPTQKHVLKVLHFALEPSAYLFLGTSESTGTVREIFSTLSKTQRIYKKVGPSRPITVARSRNAPTPEPATRLLSPSSPSSRSSGDLARRAVLDALAPPTLVVSPDGTVVFSHGELDPYTRFPQGEHPRFELNSVLRPEIATRVRGAMYKCRRDKQEVVTQSPLDAESKQARITARLAPSLGDDTVILSFEEFDDAHHERPQAPESPEHEAIFEQLERELQAMREDLRNTVEELETSNEELRSSSEESMSMNEELQSANEELEATTEELRSLNEELTTVNSQLREKVEQLEQAHDDLHNFVSSTKIATVFLDDRLCIKRFTPVARTVLGIDHADLGRFIGSIARDILQHDLVRDAQEVLEHLSGRQREVRTREGRWFVRQVLPYRTESRRIEGTVVTFVEVTELKLATERLALRERQQSVIARIGLRALQETNLDAFMEQVVRDVREALDTDYCDLLEVQPGGTELLMRAGVGWNTGCVGSAGVQDDGASSLGGQALRSREPLVIPDISTEKRFTIPELLREHSVTSGLVCVVRDGDYDYGVLGTYTTASRRFSREDVHFMQAAASVVGFAIGRFQGRVRVALELGVAQVLADATELDETLELLLERMSTELGASLIAELWRPTEDQLERVTLYASPSLDRRRVERQLAGGCVRPGEGLVGTVFEEHRAMWVTDFSHPQMLSRGDEGRSLSLTTALALPIGSGSTPLGVITLYSTERLFADDAYLLGLEGIGRSIGDFIARWETESSSRELAAITSSSHDAIFTYRVDGTITKWLRGAQELFGYSADAMLGKSVDVLVPEDRRAEMSAVTRRLVAGESIQPFETVRQRSDGQPVVVSVRVSAILDPHGNTVGVSSSDRDMSGLKNTEQQLLEAHRQKDDFIAMLGHELRNPLSTIRTASELIERGGSDPQTVRQCQAVIERQSAHMSRLLDSLLDVSRIVRGKIHTQRAIVDFTVVCEEICSDVTRRSDQPWPELRVVLPDHPVWIYGDRVRLAQVVDNLVMNAVKFTGEDGTVTVTVTVTGVEDDSEAVLTVSDTGSGIEPELLPYVFESFRQSEQTLHRPQGGLGLGLALVRSLTELHGGTVDARSDGRDRGSTFIVRLPLTTPAGPSDDDARAGARAMRILLVEDNEDSAEMMARVLERSGHDVMTAHDAASGIAMALEHRPDAVVCDIGLPGELSGYAVAPRLRGDPRTKSTVLIALSGYGSPQNKQRSAEAGFDAHLVKPVGIGDLERMLAQLRTTRRSDS